MKDLKQLVILGKEKTKAVESKKKKTEQMQESDRI